ncbi:MAG: ATP-binding protein [Solirubrobacterales bacterium]
MRSGRRISIRQLIGLLLVSAVVVAGLLFRVTTLQLDNASERREAQLDRLDDLALGDEVSANAADLTRLATLYVATGEQRFRDHHQETLNIRAGEAPRPLDYDADFWQTVIANGKKGVEYGDPIALVELARREQLTPTELEGLQEAIGESDRLAAFELGQMRSAQAGEDQGAAASSDEETRLSDDKYADRRQEIQSDIDSFSDGVAARTSRRVADLEDRRDDLLLVRAVILIALGLVVAVALFITARWIVSPLRRLTAVTRRIAEGDYSERTRPGGVSELAQLAYDFNEMAGSIQHDIARRREAEHAAEQADAAKSEFLAVMSHELRTPMVGVSGTLDVLARTDLDSDQRKLIEISQRSASSMLEIIGEVLDMSKIEAGKLTIASATVSLRNMFEDVAMQYRQAASEAGLVLLLEVDPKLAAAHVLDVNRLRQVIANLLSNAIKFTPSGRIELRIGVLGESADSQRIEIAVADTGIGIAESDQTALFEPFRQVDAGATRRAGGTGLGLVISREIAEMMGGEISLESAPGSGTTMRVRIDAPVGDPGELSEKPPHSSEHAVLGRPLPSPDGAEREGSLLLLVEDHPVNRTVMVTQLEAIGFRAETAEDGLQGLERLGGRSYALVLADIHMPNMDGYELARRLRAGERSAGAARIPIVAVTASSLSGELERCQQAGMDDLITKPATIAILAERLQRWLPDLPWQAPEPGPVELPEAPGGARIVVNEAVLAEITGDDATLQAKVLSDYVETTRKDLAAIEAAIADGDRDGARRNAHRIVGASRMVGAAAVNRIAERLEAQAPADTPTEDLAELIRELATEIDRVAAI